MARAVPSSDGQVHALPCARVPQNADGGAGVGSCNGRPLPGKPFSFALRKAFTVVLRRSKKEKPRQRGRGEGRREMKENGLLQLTGLPMLVAGSGGGMQQPIIKSSLSNGERFQLLAAFECRDEPPWPIAPPCPCFLAVFGIAVARGKFLTFESVGPSMASSGRFHRRNSPEFAYCFDQT
jgi:hypothetical protein